jgi:hypothetical protein
VVWLERDGSNSRVLTWKVGDSHPTTLSAGDYAADDPQVSGDRVVWRGDLGGHLQIFTAVLAEEPTPTPAPTATTLSKPTVSPSKPKKGKTARFATSLTPGAAGVAGAKVTLALYHQETKSVRKKVVGKWRKVKVKYWHLRKSVTMTRASGAAKYSASVKLAYKGSWKATVTGNAATGYTAPAAKTLGFTVK